MLLFDTTNVNKHWRNNLVLFICVLILFIIGPTLSFVKNAPIITNIFITLLVISAVFVIEYDPRVRKILGILGLSAIIFIWVDHLFSFGIIAIIAYALLFIFLFAITISLIIHVAVSRDVNANIIFSAINGYLLVGIIGGISLLVMDKLSVSPLLSNMKHASFDDYIYFSYVTLTTLGYGDLVPLTSGAKVVAMLLSITGQLYIAILIAMLVGKYLSKSKSK